MAEESSAYDQLHWKRKRFVDAYMECGFNATEAARRADYAHPNVKGSQLVKVSKVKEAIEERMQEHTMSANEVLFRLDQQARTDLSDFFVIEEDEEGNEVVRVDWKAVAGGEGSIAVKSIEWTKFGPKVRFHDAQNALKLLGKAYGLFKQKHEHTGEDGGLIEIADARSALMEAITNEMEEPPPE